MSVNDYRMARREDHSPEAGQVQCGSAMCTITFISTNTSFRHLRLPWQRIHRHLLKRVLSLVSVPLLVLRLQHRPPLPAQFVAFGRDRQSPQLRLCLLLSLALTP